jgi:hypothetical protein
LLVAGGHRNEHLQRAWDKYGPSAFKFKIVALCDEMELIVEEQTMINVLRTMEPEKGYNKRDAGPGGRLSSSTRTKIGAAQKGVPWSDRERAAVLAAKRTPEFKSKMSAMQKGRKHSLESRAKISEAGRGRLCSLETRAKMRASALGKPRSPETREKIGAFHRGRKRSPETRARISAAIHLWRGKRHD